MSEYPDGFFEWWKKVDGYGRMWDGYMDCARLAFEAGRSSVEQSEPESIEQKGENCEHCTGAPGESTMLRWKWNYCPECGRKLSTIEQPGDIYIKVGN